MSKENIKQDSMNIKPGYKKTAIGVIPENWEVKTFKEIGEIFVGRDVKEDIFCEFYSDKYPYPVYSNTVDNYGLYGFYSKPEYKEEAVTIVGRGVGLGTAFARRSPFGAIGRLLVLFPRESDVSFLEATINENVNFYFESAAIPQLTGVQLKNYKLPIPPLPEQKAIADCLSTWDKAIEKQTQLIKAKKEFKKGLMQGFFTGQLTVENGQLVKAKEGENFTEDWEEISFEKLFIRISAKGFQVKTKEYLETGKYPIVDQGKEKIIGYSNQNCVFRNVPIIVFGDHTRILKYIDFEFAVGADGTQLLDKKKPENNLKFLFYLLSSSHIPNLGYSRHMRVLKTKRFKIPTPKLQSTIVQVLQSADYEIELLEKKLVQFQIQKKGLMQVLLTGEKRLV